MDAGGPVSRGRADARPLLEDATDGFYSRVFPDDPAPSRAFFALRWGDLADLWAACELHPTARTRKIATAIKNTFADAIYGDRDHSLTLGDIMGMYDREPNFEDDFRRGDRFVLMGLDYVGEISTSKGPAQKVLVKLITRESYPNTLTYSALGVGLAAMAQKAEPSDFPHVVEFIRSRRPSGNEVKLFARVDVTPADWRQGDDGPPLNLAEIEPPTPDGEPTPSRVDPGF